MTSNPASSRFCSKIDSVEATTASMVDIARYSAASYACMLLAKMCRQTRSTVRVMFDGFRSATSLHSTYIEPVAGEEGSSSRDRR
jgi:hypothetical protein